MSDPDLLDRLAAQVRLVLREIAPPAALGCPRAATAARLAARVLRIAELLERLPEPHRAHAGNMRILRAQMSGLLLHLEERHPEHARGLAHLLAELGRTLPARESGSDFDAVAEALARRAS